MAIDNDGYTIKEAAEALNVSPKTIRRMISQGTLASVLIQGKYGPEYHPILITLRGVRIYR